MTKDNKEWIPLKERYPPKYHLVLVVHSDGRVQSGWYTGHGWDGRRKINGETILAWKSLEATSRKELNEC